MKIVGVCGSLRPDSVTSKVLTLALNKSEKFGHESKNLNLKNLELPFCDGSQNYPNFPGVDLLRDAFKTSHGIILATPEYHGCISGVLKNALDLLDESHIQGKAVGLISICGGVHSSNALNTMRLICRHLHAFVIPDQIIIAHSDLALSYQGLFQDPSLEDRIDKFVHHLCNTAKKLA